MEYLAQILHVWSPQVDRENVIQSPRRQVSCLQIAARNGRAELVASFLDVWGGWAAEEQKKALVGAAATRWDECVGVLLARLTYEQNDLQVALEWAIRKRMILAEGETDNVRKKRLGHVTLDELEADATCRQHRVICHRVDAGTNPDGPGLYVTDGGLLLFAAVQLDYPGCMGALLEKGANASTQGSDGETALNVLLCKGPSTEYFGFQDTPQDRMAATQLLLDHGASPDTANEAGETALHPAAQYGSVEQLQLCLAHARLADAVRQPNRQGESPLHYAAAPGRDEIVEYLLANGAADDVDIASHNGWTPLLFALSPRKCKSEEMAVRVTACLLTHELIKRGTPLDAEPAFLRDANVTPDKLDGNWGFRMQKLAKSIGEDNEAAATKVDDGAGSAVPDTTPLAWAIRTGALDLVQVILDSL